MESPSTRDNSLTPSQEQAVVARGNVLVMAGAGTGKTKTLIERCLNCLEQERAALNELLIVTFTEAAAAEMRQRLRKKLEDKSATHLGDEHWSKQLALFDVAHIGTLHSFCLRLVREHFYELGVDPQFAVLDEGGTLQRANETLDEIFQSHYAGEDGLSRAVQDLIQIHGGGRDENIRKLVLRLHHYSQARPNAAQWLASQLEYFSADEPDVWNNWLHAAIVDWRNDWLGVLEPLKTENIKAAELVQYFLNLTDNFTRPDAAETLENIVKADETENYPPKKAGKLRLALGSVFDEAKFLKPLCVVKNGADPLTEDWNWVRVQMISLLRLAQEFEEAFSKRKLADGAMDFHDLEQFTLKLLWNFEARQPTAVAKSWQTKLRFVFVDEYQDINAAQDKIIEALSRSGAGADVGSAEDSQQMPNRFLVGDVKQSIYRFRLADPTIFRDYARNWHGATGKTIPLAENFRSHESLLIFVNSVCGLVMREEIGGVGYDADAELKPGKNSAAKLAQSSQNASILPSEQRENTRARVELLLRLKPGRQEALEDTEGELADLDEAQKEARLVAIRLKKIVTEKRQIWDGHTEQFRAIDWRDIAILLRSPRAKSEVFVKEFERAHIPLAVARGGFYQSAEILDLLSLLRLLDNPLQDVPCIAVLRSPFVGLSLDELAQIRLVAKGHFWTALNRFHEQSQSGKIVDADSKLVVKIEKFLNFFSRWRRLAKQNSLSQCLEEVLDETLYADWLRAQSRGAQRLANVNAFLNLAQQFDQFQRQGLFRFLKFIETQQEMESEPDISATPTENAVRLMSIHQSKGLEFPVVVLADLSKSFNEQDLRSEIIFDEKLGLCPKVKPPGSGRRYPSLPYWLAQCRQKRELRGEELRLLYVALTRARDHLILTGTITEKKWDENWSERGIIGPQKIAGARSFADWLALWFAQNVAATNLAESETPLLRWRLIDDAKLAQEWNEFHSVACEKNAEPALLRSTSDEVDLNTVDAAVVNRLEDRLSWKYPFTIATERKAKSSVTALRREAAEEDDEAEQMFSPTSGRQQRTKLKSAKKLQTGLSAAQIGAAHHHFLQHVDLKNVNDLAKEAERLEREGYLSAEERKSLDLKALKTFWDSDLGQKICAHTQNVRRELPFTARFSPEELTKIIGGESAAGLENEFVVVQGVADLVVMLLEEIWLVDFKTDQLSAKLLPDKIKMYTPQLRLYALALEKIFKRPVTLRALHFLALGRTETITD